MWPSTFRRLEAFWILGILSSFVPARRDRHLGFCDMGQKTRPTGFRVGIVEDWRSRWYASKKEFGDLLGEDFKIRKFIKKKYLFAGIPNIEIERTRDMVIGHLHCTRPGL